MCTYGFVLENTSDQVILRLPVTFGFLDADGAVIHEDLTVVSDDDPAGDTVVIPVLRPGERVGVGGMAYPGRPGAAEVQVEVGEAGDWVPQESWLTIFAPDRRRGELVVTDVAVRPGESAEPLTSFTVESTYEQALEPMRAHVIFYDAEGRVIGGAHDPRAMESIPAGAAVDVEVALGDPIEVPGVDPARTEVYFPGWRVRQR